MVRTAGVELLQKQLKNARIETRRWRKVAEDNLNTINRIQEKLDFVSSGRNGDKFLLNQSQHELSLLRARESTLRAELDNMKRENVSMSAACVSALKHLMRLEDQETKKENVWNT